MTIDEVLSKRNKQRVANLRAVAARYEQQNDLAKALDWTPSYLSQLIGPNPSRPITERTARSIEQTLKLAPGLLDAEGPPPEVRDAVSGDLLDDVMIKVDSALRDAGVRLPEEKYRHLVSHLYRTASSRGADKVERADVEALIRLVK